MAAPTRSVPDLSAFHWPIIGFTGTRAPVTPEQEAGIRRIMQEVGGRELHHGDCVSADALAHRVARELGLDVVLHPPAYKNQDWANCMAKVDVNPGKGSVRREPDAEHLERDHHIVDACDGLIVVPRSREEQMRGSGTWATYRYAVGANKTVRAKVLKPAIMVFPDGTLELRTPRVVNSPPKGSARGQRKGKGAMDAFLGGCKREQ